MPEPKRIHSFLVHAGHGAQTQPPIRDAAVTRKKSEKLFEVLADVFARAETECRIDIKFRARPDGRQQNDCRDLLRAYVNDTKLALGRPLASRLQSVTTHRSGLGLFFVMIGEVSSRTQVVLARFPADTGILAETSGASLSIKYLETIFMKSAYSYKSAVFVDRASASTSFWMGRVVDKQINSRAREVSGYWVSEFLDAELRITDAAGTRRLAKALKQATARASSLQVKQELVAAATLAGGLQGKVVSVREFGKSFHLSTPAQEALEAAVPGEPVLLTERFGFDTDEFKKTATYRATELDSGVFVSAPAERYDEVVQQEQTKTGKTRLVAEGRVIGTELHTRRR